MEVIELPWQERRAEFSEILRGVQSGDSSSVQKLDAVLTEFERKNLYRTPIENVEIIGAYYFLRDGIEASLPLLASTAVLGWYDALRFASPSGKQEVVHALFRLPFLLAGEEFAEKAVKFFGENQERTAYLVSQGLAVAKANRDKTHYDQTWPTAFGLEPMIHAQDPSDWEPTAPLPVSEWDLAWAEAEQAVKEYFCDKT